MPLVSPVDQGAQMARVEVDARAGVVKLAIRRPLEIVATEVDLPFELVAMMYHGVLTAQLANAGRLAVPSTPSLPSGQLI